MHRTALLICAFAALSLAQAASPDEKLQYVVIMSRHGNRSPLWSEAQQNSYSAQPWPKWAVPTGYLTPHGRTGMELMGRYYRQYLTQQNLIPTSGCAGAEKFFFWSDTDERDLETGHAIASRLFPGCTAAMHESPNGKIDPLFSPVKAGLAKEDTQARIAAIAAQIGGSPSSVLERYKPQLNLMQKILLNCEPQKTCSPEAIEGKKFLLNHPAGPGAETASVSDVMKTLDASFSIADMFLLEYTEGMPPKDVGWGRVNKSNLSEILLLQQATVDLALRAPYPAHVNGSNLMSHILKSLQQAAEGETVPGSLGRPGDKGLVFLGHDSNESWLEGVLKTTSAAEGYPPNARPPGSSLVFELWKNTAGNKYSVRAWFVTQTLDQLRNNTPLSLKMPPVRVPLIIPGCGGASCDWERFKSVVGADIDPAFVSSEPLAEATSQWMK